MLLQVAKATTQTKVKIYRKVLWFLYYLKELVSVPNITIAVAVILTLILVVAGVVICKRKRQSQPPEDVRNDLNPIYGLYYFDDDSKIDSGESEVVDSNDYYQAE